MTVKIHEQAVRALAERGGPATEVLRAHARAVMAAAKARARRSPHGHDGRPSGYMASQITIREGTDTRGFYVDVITTARNPKGFPYGSLIEMEFPYLLPGARRANRDLRKSGTKVRSRTRRKRKRST